MSAASSDDPALDALPETVRRAAANAWEWRASSELTASVVFARIAESLSQDGAANDVVALATRAIDEERTHAALARDVAARYAQRDVPEPRVRPIGDARFGDSGDRTNRLLFLVLHCCINETIAAAYLRECLREAETETARAAVRALLADEMSHARIGWAHLASPHVTDRDRAHVQGALPVLLRLARQAWLAPIPGTEGLVRGHGALCDDSLVTTVETALGEVVGPGFEHVGVGANFGVF